MPELSSLAQRLLAEVPARSPRTVRRLAHEAGISRTHARKAAHELVVSGLVVCRGAGRGDTMLVGRSPATLELDRVQRTLRHLGLAWTPEQGEP